MSSCKECESARKKVANQNNREKRLVVAQKWRDENRDTYKAALASWNERNPGKRDQTIKDWVQRNRGYVNAKWMKRDAGKKCRTPPWTTAQMTAEINTEYALDAWCSAVMGEPYHVDHIVPLQGKLVSGLHAPWNLQVITARENQCKSNKFLTLEGI